MFLQHIFYITDVSNGNAIDAHDQLMYHVEHINIFTKKSFDIFLQSLDINTNTNIYWNSPQGLSFIVIEKI